MRAVLLGLGSSLSDRYRALWFALLHIERLEGVRLLRVSSTYRSTPLGSAKNLFLNACCVVETSWEPLYLLQRLKHIEARVGRRKTERWADRVIYIDILLFENVVYADEALTIPHPELCHRSFVMQPAVEIAGGWVHPAHKLPLHAIKDQFPRCWPIGCLPFVARALRQDSRNIHIDGEEHENIFRHSKL